MTRRIGIYGGTFDPVHIGHLVAADEVCAVLGLDQLLFLPAGDPPHKRSNAKTPAHHRLRMIELAIEDNAHFGVSTLDLDRPGPHYTADTLAIMHAEEPDAERWFVMGVDNLLDLPNWMRPSELVRFARLAVVTRPGWKVGTDDLRRLDAAIPGVVRCCDFVTIPMLDIASRQLRERLRTNAPYRYQLRPAVEAYITAHSLYRDDSTVP